MWNDSTETGAKYRAARSSRASTGWRNGGKLERQVRRFSTKKLTLAVVALCALLGTAGMVSAQSDPDPVEPDTPGRCGDGDVGDSFATAYDLGNAEAWPASDSPYYPRYPGDPSKERTVVSDFECGGDLDVYRFEVSSLVGITLSAFWPLARLVGERELYDSGGDFVIFDDNDLARLLPGIYYFAVATRPLAEHRTETGRYEFSLFYEPLIPEIQPTMPLHLRVRSGSNATACPGSRLHGP